MDPDWGSGPAEGSISAYGRGFPGVKTENVTYITGSTQYPCHPYVHPNHHNQMTQHQDDDGHRLQAQHWQSSSQEMPEFHSSYEHYTTHMGMNPVHSADYGYSGRARHMTPAPYSAEPSCSHMAEDSYQRRLVGITDYRPLQSSMPSTYAARPGPPNHMPPRNLPGPARQGATCTIISVQPPLSGIIRAESTPIAVGRQAYRPILHYPAPSGPHSFPPDDPYNPILEPCYAPNHHPDAPQRQQHPVPAHQHPRSLPVAFMPLLPPFPTPGLAHDHLSDDTSLLDPAQQADSGSSDGQHQRLGQGTARSAALTRGPGPGMVDYPVRLERKMSCQVCGS